MVNVLLIGIGITTLTALESLMSKCHVLGVVRDFQINDPVVDLAQQANIPVFPDTSQHQIKSLILELQPDCVVVSSYNQILPPSLINLSTFINVHYSPLPQYRGRANVNWAIINHETSAAITIHKISPDLDEGNILYQQLIPIYLDDTVANLYERLNQIQCVKLADTVIQSVHGDEGVPQNNSEATYTCTRLPEDGEINWSDTSKDIYALVRSLVEPFPGAYTYFQGKKLLIRQAKPLENPPVYVGRIPGRIIARSKTIGFVDVLTGDGVMRIFEVNFIGEEKTAAANIIQSVKSTLGLQISELLNQIQNLETQINQLKENAK